VNNGDARTEFGAEEGLRWRKAGKADAWAVGEACAMLGRGWTRRTTREGEENRPVAIFKGRQGTAERGGSNSGDATRRAGGVGPGCDRRAASQPRPGRGAPTRLMHGPRLSVGEGVRRERRGRTWASPKKRGVGRAVDEQEHLGFIQINSNKFKLI
jgi:hypothetical protein